MKNTIHKYFEDQYRFVPPNHFGYKVLMVDWARAKVLIQSKLGVTWIPLRGVLESSVPLTENLI